MSAARGPRRGADPGLLRPGGGDDLLRGGAGRDRLFSHDGDETYDGGPGRDMVTFKIKYEAISVDLARGTGSGAGGTYTLRNVESLHGSGDDDIAGRRLRPRRRRRHDPRG